MTDLELMGNKSKKAERILKSLSEDAKTVALLKIADSLMENKEKILKANDTDIAIARENGMAPSMIDRLTLTSERINAMSDGIIAVSKWPDPVGKVLEEFDRPNGLHIKKVSVPLGVIGIIFEARPNVTSDCAALCIRAGNTVILRGGKEAFNSNSVIAEVMQSALAETDVPEDSIQLVTDTSRASANEMMTLNQYLDVLIPRGGSGLIRSVVDNAKVPVIETGTGNCHIYIDKDADIKMAADIIFNAKTSRPSVCNAAEKLLVHKNIAERALPEIASMLSKKNVLLRGDKKAKEIIPSIALADESDWGYEYLDYILGIKVVDSIDEAIEHIEKYSTHHSDCIVTNNQADADKFLSSVDSACVYHNASTRFTDGGEMGLGAEIGISTQRLHARGPMGVNQLVTYKYIITGNGQTR